MKAAGWLVLAALVAALALGFAFGADDADVLRSGANAATREQVYQACTERADRLTEGAGTYGEYEARVAEAIAARAECERLYGSVVREGTVEAQGREGR